MRSFIAISSLSFALICCFAHAKTLYVSRTGRDTWSGALPDANKQLTDGPLATLVSARNKIRQLRKISPKEEATILIRAGQYRLNETLTLSPEDSNTTYAAYHGERPEIMGGHLISGWAKLSTGPWTAPATGRFRQLFVNGTRAQRARSPNEGFYRINGSSSTDPFFALPFHDDEVRPTWAGKDVEVVILLLWSEVRMLIDGVDTRNHVAKLSKSSPSYKREKDARYWIENAPEALDSPGEWYQDVAARTVTYWPMPRAGTEPPDDEIVAPDLISLVSLLGRPERGEFVSNVAFKGLQFKYADWSMPPDGLTFPQAALEAPSAMAFVGARDTLVDHCTFSHLGGYALHIGRGSQGAQVTHNEIYDMGAGGIKIGETAQNSDAEKVSGNIIADNHIHNLGLVYPSAVGVWVGQSGNNLISHNDIHDLFYTGISMGWTWGYDANSCDHNIVEFNNLHDVGKGMLSDLAGIYTLGVQTGTVIRNNLIHRVSAWGYLAAGIYLDNGTSNIEVTNNIVYDTRDGLFNQGNANNNSITNNIFAFNYEYQLMRDPPTSNTLSSFQRNIVVSGDGDLLDNNWGKGQVKMDGNLYWREGHEILRLGGKPLSEWRKLGNDLNSVLADPQFAGAATYDFRLLPASPALKIGFQPVDLSTVGPRSKAGAGF